MRVILKELDEQQTYPQYTRWNDDCECVQITFDGTTWVDSPENDPRYGGGFRAPALTGDAQCDAAARMVAVIRAQVDAAIEAAEAVALATSLLSIVTAFLPGINIIVTVFVAVASAVLVFGAAALAADFTEENYDKLTCIFYNNIDADGQVSAAQLDDILSDIDDEFAISVIYPVCQLLFQTLGENGFSNAGVIGTETGDCEDCDGWCYTWLDGDGFSPPWTIDFGSYSSDMLEGENTTPSTGNTVLLQAKIPFASTVVTFYEIAGGYKSGDTFGGNAMQIGNGVVYGTNVFAQVSPTPTFTETTFTMGGDSLPGAVVGVWIQIGIPSKDTLDTYLRVTKITLKGTGANPFGDDNC